MEWLAIVLFCVFVAQVAIPVLLFPGYPFVSADFFLGGSLSGNRCNIGLLLACCLECPVFQVRNRGCLHFHAEAIRNKAWLQSGRMSLICFGQTDGRGCQIRLRMVFYGHGWVVSFHLWPGAPYFRIQGRL